VGLGVVGGIVAFGEAEIENFGVAFASDHDVFGFDVAMDDADLMGGGEAGGDLGSDFEGAAEG
jgi:hypothetical protein